MQTRYITDGSGNVLSSTQAESDQSATASTAGAASVDFGQNSWVYVDGDASFNLTIIDTTSIPAGVLCTMIVENTTAGQITVTDGITSATNISASFVLDAGQYMRLQIFTIDSTLHVVGGAAA